ncbi:MAG: FxsA family protein [Alphaproteobacteria bacterium]|nr:FxsA family protein [Alphaproteobacteria bacterium]
MLIFLITLFIIGPIAEIYVLLAAGSAFGVLPVIGACLATAFLGGWIIRLQGLAALNIAQQDMRDGRLPVASAINGALLIVAAPFLMTPGFLTDAIGFALLIPPLRLFLARLAIKYIKKRIDRGDATITIIRP